MSYLPVEHWMTADDFLRWQDGQSEPHELIAGHPHPLPPRDPTFFRLLVNLTSAIQTQLGAASAWSTALSALPLIADDHHVLMPDAVMTPLDALHAPPIAMVFPLSTRGLADLRRWAALRRMPTLHELIVVDRETRTITVERRTEAGGWTVERLETDGVLNLDVAGIRVLVADAFANMDRPHPSLTLQEFCAWESTQLRRHEFFHGRIRAMTGARLDHCTVCMNLAATLHGHLQGSPCRVFAADAAVKTPAADIFYPDVVVSCEPIDGTHPWLHGPILVIEVLSVSTRRFDRTQKAQAYFLIPSLQEYVLVDHVRRRIDLHRREPDGQWSRHASIGDAPLELQSVDLTIPAELIYERIAANGQEAA